MASTNLSDKDIEALKDSLRATTGATLKIERFSLGLAWLGLFVSWFLVIGGALWSNSYLIALAIAITVLSLWLRSGVAQDRLKRLEAALALHLLGADSADEKDTEPVE